MIVETINMHPTVAREEYLKYRRACAVGRERRRRELKERASKLGKEMNQVRIAKTQLDREDDMLREVYKNISRGLRVLHLPTAFLGAGLNKQFLPVIAIARADTKQCRMYLNNEVLKFADSSDPWNPRKQVELPRRLLPAELTDAAWRTRNSHPSVGLAVAQVPSIPPQYRPEEPHKYYILWEAEWSIMPPVDPILLKKVTPDHYVVVAQWDLTPVEQSVLMGRRS